VTDSLLVRLGIGSRLRIDGDVVEIVGLNDTHAILLDGAGRVSSLSVAELLADRRRTQLLDARPVAEREPGAIGLSLASDESLENANSRAAHVREVLTGYRSGHEDLALPGEPRPQYAPDVAMMRRYVHKAAEVGVVESTVRKWVRKYQEGGEAALLQQQRHGPLAAVDTRWLDTARALLDELTDISTVTRKLVLQRIAARLDREYGPGVVPLPQRTSGYRLLRELSRGRNTFTGSAKGRREIAARPQGVYGRLRATRPGEYLVLDTTALDVFAMEPLTLRWVGAQLTGVAMDLYSRCIVGLRLTPVSAKAVDVASVVFQALRPPQVPQSWPEHARWPYPGWPSSVVVDADGVAGPLVTVTPPLRPETIIADHGRIYLSEHVTSACARVGISIQPARLYRPTDKPVERFFRTLRQGLLEALPGYKGPDVFSRGRNIEQQAYFFLNELEDIIREWTATVYHHRPHDGLADPHVPGLPLSPAQMFSHGVARAGYVMVPPDPDLVYEFLQVVWRNVHHYGVEVGGLRYQDRTGVLAPYVNRDSGFHHPKARGRWPIHVDPDDVSRVFFRDPHTKSWHPLWWEHLPMLGMPFSADTLAFAKRMALEHDRFPDTANALAELLQRWQVGLSDTPAERRIALRAAATQAAPALPITAAPPVHGRTDADSESDSGSDGGSDGGMDEGPSSKDTESFYADAWQALQ